MSDRSCRVVVLLGLRFVWVPAPRTWTGGMVERMAGRGEVPSRRVKCRRCQGAGKVGRDRCERCDGRGFEVVDDYTGKPVGDEQTSTVLTDDFWRRRQRRLDRDRLIERAELAERTRMGLIDPRESEGWERVKEGLWRQGSFAELEAALGALRRVRTHDYEALETVFGVDAALRRIAMPLRQRADRAVELVASVMPDPIRVPEGSLLTGSSVGKGRWANAWAQERRDVEIRRLSEQGFGQAAIGRRLGVSQPTVSKVLARRAA